MAAPTTFPSRFPPQMLHHVPLFAEKKLLGRALPYWIYWIPVVGNKRSVISITLSGDNKVRRWYSVRKSHDLVKVLCVAFSNLHVWFFCWSVGKIYTSTYTPKIRSALQSKRICILVLISPCYIKLDWTLSFRYMQINRKCTFFRYDEEILPTITHTLDFSRFTTWN